MNTVLLDLLRKIGVRPTIFRSPLFDTGLLRSMDDLIISINGKSKVLPRKNVDQFQEYVGYQMICFVICYTVRQ